MRHEISESRSVVHLAARLSGTFLVSLLLAPGCSHPAAQETSAKADPPATLREEGVVHIPEASRPFIEVQEVSAVKNDSTVSAPAHVDFRDGAVSQVGAPLEGRVQTVHVTVGQKVRKDDPLVTLDCPDAAAMRASVDVAQVSLREARLELDRQQRMQQEGVGTERDLVAAQTKVSSAEAEVARAQSTAGTIGQSAGTTVIVRAPIAGIIIGRKATAGLAVQRGGDPLVEIGDASALWIVADVFERDLAAIRVGAKSRISFAALGHDLEGRVTSVGTVVGSRLRTATVFLTTDELHPTIRPGMYGRVQIDVADAAVTLPVSAVLIKDDKAPVVYVQQDPLTYVRREVVLSQPVEGRVQILSGLKPGEKVVVRGALLLDGTADQLL